MVWPRTTWQHQTWLFQQYFRIEIFLEG
jgi:hypothetical protein